MNVLKEMVDVNIFVTILREATTVPALKVMD